MAVGAVSRSVASIANSGQVRVFVVLVAIDTLQCRNLSEIDPCFGAMAAHYEGMIAWHSQRDDDADYPYDHHQLDETEAM